MSDRQRIVIVGPMYPYRGGIAHLSETIATRFSDRGYDVHAITFTRQYPAFLFPGQTQFETSPPPERSVVAERMIDSINPYSWWKVIKRIRELRADVVIFRYWMPFFAPAFGVIARRLARHKIRSIALVDNALPHERQIGDIALGRFFFKVMQGCVVMSESVEQELEKLKTSCPLAFAPHPVYDTFGEPVDQANARTKLQLDQDQPILLFFGFVREYKGLNVLIDSMQEVRNRYPNICLVVAGEFYESEASYRGKIEVLGLSKNIKIVNQYIPKEEVAGYFAAADVVVQPYISATQSGVAQVAYQFEVPVITTDVGGLAEAIPHEEAGLIVPPNDASALAKAIIQYFDEDMQKKLTIGVKNRKQTYSWDQLLNAIESVM